MSAIRLGESHSQITYTGPITQYLRFGLAGPPLLSVQQSVLAPGGPQKGLLRRLLLPRAARPRPRCRPPRGGMACGGCCCWKPAPSGTPITGPGCCPGCCWPGCCCPGCCWPGCCWPACCCWPGCCWPRCAAPRWPVVSTRPPRAPRRALCDTGWSHTMR